MHKPLSDYPEAVPPGFFRGVATAILFAAFLWFVTCGVFLL